MSIRTFTGCRIFTGAELLAGHAVRTERARVIAAVPRGDVPPTDEIIDLGGGLLTPGFIDVQVNGGGGTLLNDEPTLAGVRRIAQSHRQFGTVGLMPTVITDRPEVLARAIAAVRASGLANVLGIHIEGPFIDPARKGAHDAAFIRAITDADVAQLVAADCGITMLTLAPNKVPPATIRELVARGIRVSLGHSDASCAEARAALAAGATAFTHLYNAMSGLTGRAPGMIGAALLPSSAFIGLIADGHHVSDEAMRIAFAAAGYDRFMLVSDAMPPAAGGPDRFLLQGREVTRAGDRLQLADGTLAGSNLTMDAAVRYAVERLGVPLAEALRMASLHPARFLGRDRELGVIAPGALASLVHLDDGLRVKASWVEGE